MVEKRELLYVGKAKQLFETEDKNVLWVEYLGQATALNGKKKDLIQGKGELNNKITSAIFEKIKKVGIHSHFIEKISETEQLIERLTIIPLEVVVRNVAAGSFSKRFGIEEGVKLPYPIVEFYYKNDALDDPFMNDAHVTLLNIATEEEVKVIKENALKVNAALIDLFNSIDITLIDFKLEFGKNAAGEIVLGDEISPDTCRLWDKQTNDHLDKDVYRRDLGDILPVYEEVLRRLSNKTNVG